MDSFMSFNSCDTEEEERPYCSAPQNEEDIIWAGSDAEQSAEERTSKRLRYEHHAQRYIRGHIPVLHSASLTGPFGKDWVNPWRYRQRKVPNWWQPGSKDMMFTRANVLKRAADHGMGHLRPAEALAWCKAEAEAEAQRKIKAESGSEERAISGAYLDEESDMDDQAAFPSLKDAQQDGTGEAPATSDTPYFNSHEEQYSTVAPQHNMPEYPDEGREESALKTTKRPADSQWLKASYISKRARWDSPGHANSSPTPMPALHTRRDRIQPQSFMSPPKLRDGYTNLASTPKTPWPHEVPADEHLDPLSNSTTTGASHIGSRNMTMSLASGVPPIDPSPSEYNGALDDCDHHQRPRGESLDSEASDFEGRKFQDSLADSQQHSFSTLEPGNIFTPAFTQISTINKRKLHASAPGSSTVPTPFGRNAESAEDVSFITEVAPSSRNLEQFQYRKKRRRSRHQQSVDANESFEEHVKIAPRSTSKSSLDEMDISGTHSEEEVNDVTRDYSSDSDMTSVHPASSEGDAISLLREQSPVSISSPSDKVTATREVCFNEDTIDVEENNAVRDEMFDSSRDIMDDVQDLKITITTNYFVKEAEPPSDGCSPDHSPAVEVPIPDDQSSSNPESRDLQNAEPVAICPSQTSSDEMNVEGEPAVQEVKEPMEKPDPADVSTQSFNTTPTRSLRSPYNRSTASAKVRQSPRKCMGTEASGNTISFTGVLRDVAGDTTAYVAQEELSLQGPQDQMKDETIDVATGVVATLEEILDPMQAIQNALSQDYRSSAKSSSQSVTNDEVSTPHIFSDEKVSKVENNTPVETVNPEATNKDQASWQGGGPQSPWATLNIDLIPAYAEIRPHEDESCGVAESEVVAEPTNSPEQNVSEDGADWQRFERPETPELDEIKPFRDFNTPEPSPEPPVSQPIEDDLLSTQLLAQAVTTNPWTSSFKNPASGKYKKRVSFGILSSEEDESSPPHGSSMSRHVSGSPPPDTAEKPHEEDDFHDGTTAVDTLENHFLTAGRANGDLPRKNYPSLYSSSPAVGAMAEAFIAADRETSADYERRRIPEETPTRHLKPSSKARTNFTLSDMDGPPIKYSYSKGQDEKFAPTSKIIDYDLGVDFDDYLGDAGGFLEEWSVEAELRKGKSAGQNTRRSDQTKSLFDITNEWE
jgi:hypothetical protein